jgi:histidinol phosphatase-like PHP family hydrolase
MKLLNLADHCWPDTRAAVLPRPENLPEGKHCFLLHGAEVDMDMNDNLSASIAEIEAMDFAVIAFSHLHLKNYCVPKDFPEDAETHKKRFLERVHHLLSLDLPFHKTGLAHFTCELLCTAEPYRCLDLISDAELIDIFTKVRDRGMGVELNFVPDRYKPDDLREVLRPYFIAKNLGCKFYFASDAHHPEGFCGVVKRKMEPIIDLLDLTEEDKFPFVKEMIAGMDG